MIYKRLNFEDGGFAEPCQFVGVYVLKWRAEWGPPEAAFVEDPDAKRLMELGRAVEQALWPDDTARDMYATAAKLHSRGLGGAALIYNAIAAWMESYANHDRAAAQSQNAVPAKNGGDDEA